MEICWKRKIYVKRNSKKLSFKGDLQNFPLNNLDVFEKVVFYQCIIGMSKYLCGFFSLYSLKLEKCTNFSKTTFKIYPLW